jgi:hypothetical protein
MPLSGSDGQAIELQIAGYQFPETLNDRFDANWLVIAGRVRHPSGCWIFRDPCLLTFEFAQLAGWLEAVEAGKQDNAEISFIEPNLWFRLGEYDPGAALRVFFELESRPGWASCRVAFANDLWVEFPLGELDLKRAAADLREQLVRFPERGT